MKAMVAVSSFVSEGIYISKRASPSEDKFSPLTETGSDVEDPKSTE